MKLKWRAWSLAVLCGLAVGSLPATGLAQEKELKIGYQKHPIQEASIAMFEKWGKANGVKITRVPNAYGVYVEKMTASLTSSSGQYDIIWHNDDWGQLWKKLLEPTDGIAGMNLVAKEPVDAAFLNDDGKPTVVPMVHTVGTFFYRADLLKPSEVPTTWDELVKTSERLQKEGKVKWGFVGGMAMNHTWFTMFWTMWGNQCDIFNPTYSRDNAKLAAAGWAPQVGEPCQREAVEFWWDAMNKYKFSPPAMPSYGRDEANAIFMAGDAAFTVADSTLHGLFSDPAKSKVAGKIAMAPQPMGPRRKRPFAWNDIWGWAIPKNTSAAGKALAAQALAAMLADSEGQVALWKATGGPPPNISLWKQIEASDPVFRQLKHAVFDQDTAAHGAYYFAQWPAVHKAYSDAVIAAVTGPREKIGETLKASVQKVHDAAVAQ
jgi:ABC-type glycerol-3-phosphate transport system substrate-binding protein